MMLSEDTTPVAGVTCYVRLRLTPTAVGTCVELAVSRRRPGNAVKRVLMNTIGERTLPETFNAGLAQVAEQLAAEESQAT